MSERLTAEELERIRTYDHYYGYANSAVRKLGDHIDALTAENARLRKQVEAANELADYGEEIVEYVSLRVIRQQRLRALIDAYRATATEDAEAEGRAG